MPKPQPTMEPERDVTHFKIVAEKFQQVRVQLVRSLAAERARCGELEMRLQQAKEAEHCAVQAAQRAIVTAKEYSLLDRIAATLRDENKKCRDEIQVLKNQASVDADVASARVAAWERNSLEAQRSLEQERRAAREAAREARDAAERDKKALQDAFRKKEEEMRRLHEEALSALRAELASVREECAEEMNVATMEFEDRAAQLTERIAALEAEQMSLQQKLSGTQGNVEYLESRLVEMQHANSSLERDNGRLLESNRSLMLQQQRLLAAQVAQRTARAPQQAPRPRFSAPVTATKPRFQYSLPPPTAPGSYPQLSMAWRRGVSASTEAEQDQLIEESIQASTHIPPAPPPPPPPSPPKPAPPRRRRKAFETVEMACPPRPEDVAYPAPSSRPPIAVGCFKASKQREQREAPKQQAAKQLQQHQTIVPAPPEQRPQQPPAPIAAAPSGKFTFKRRMFTTASQPPAPAAVNLLRDSPVLSAAVTSPPLLREIPAPLTSEPFAPEVQNLPKEIHATPHLIRETPVPSTAEAAAPPAAVAPGPIPTKTPSSLAVFETPAPLSNATSAPSLLAVVDHEVSCDRVASGTSSAALNRESVEEATPFQPPLCSNITSSPQPEARKKLSKDAAVRSETPETPTECPQPPAAPATKERKGSRRLFSSSVAPDSYLQFLSKLPASKMRFTVPAGINVAPAPPPAPLPSTPKPRDATSLENTRQFFQQLAQQQEHAPESVPASAPEEQVENSSERLEPPPGAAEPQIQESVERLDSPGGAPPVPQVQGPASATEPKPLGQETTLQREVPTSAPVPPAGRLAEVAEAPESAPACGAPGNPEAPQVRFSQQSERVAEEQPDAGVPPPQAAPPAASPIVPEVREAREAPAENATSNVGDETSLPGTQLVGAIQSASLIVEDPLRHVTGNSISLSHTACESILSTTAASQPNVGVPPQLRAPGEVAVEAIPPHPSSEAFHQDLGVVETAAEEVCSGRPEDTAGDTQPLSPPRATALHPDGTGTETKEAGMHAGTVADSPHPVPLIVAPGETPFSPSPEPADLDSWSKCLPRANTVNSVNTMDDVVPMPGGLAVEMSDGSQSTTTTPRSEAVADVRQCSPPDQAPGAAPLTRTPVRSVKLGTWLSCLRRSAPKQPAPTDATPARASVETAGFQSKPTPPRRELRELRELVSDVTDVQQCSSLTCSPPEEQGTPSSRMPSVDLGRRNIEPLLASPGCTPPATSTSEAGGNPSRSSIAGSAAHADEAAAENLDCSISYSPLSSTSGDASLGALVIDWTAEPPSAPDHADGLDGEGGAAVHSAACGTTALHYLQECYEIGCSQQSKPSTGCRPTTRSMTSASKKTPGSEYTALETPDKAVLKRSADTADTTSPSPSDGRVACAPDGVPRPNGPNNATPRRAVPLGVREKKRRRLHWADTLDG